MVVSDFCWSCVAELLEGELEPFEPEVEPLPAEPLVLLDEELLGREDDAPPLDGLFWSEVDDELDEGELLEGEEPEVLAEPEAEPEGEDGVVAPLEDEEPDGEVLDGLALEPVADLLPPPLSQAVSRLAPNARETAIANVDNLMGPPWLGLLGG